MALTDQIAALASRVATEFGVVRGEVDGHTHAPQAVPVAPRVMSAGASVEVDGAEPGDVQLTCTADTVITPTGTPNGRMMIVEALASGGQRSPSVHPDVEPNAGVPSRTLTVPEGQVGVFGLRYSALAGGWMLMAADVNGAAPDVTAPAVPSGLSATPGNGQVTLDWVDNPEPDVAGYDYRYGTSNPPAGAATRVVSSAVIVTGLTNSTSYYFQVRAVDDSDNASDWTTVVSATPTASTTVPGAPTSVAGTAGNGQVSLTWSAPASNGGSAITDYVVQYSSDSGSSWTTFVDGTSTTAAATVTGLTNGTAYIFQVAAVNSVGTGAYSTASSPVTPVAPSGTTITDNFTGTAGATLAGRAAGWSTGAGDFVISPSGTTAQKATTQAALLVALVGPLSTSNHEVSVTLPTRGAAPNPGVVARANSAGDTFYAIRVASSGGVISVQRSVAGTVTIIADQLASYVTGDRLTLRVIGDQITVLRNGANLTTFTDAGITTGTYAGIRGGGNATQATFDDFSAADA